MEAQRTTIEKLIDAAVQAGALSASVKIYPESRVGLERAWRWHDARVAALATEISHAADPARSAAAGMTTTPKR